jgi:hypothetical protein
MQAGKVGSVILADEADGLLPSGKTRAAIGWFELSIATGLFTFLSPGRMPGSTSAKMADTTSL